MALNTKSVNRINSSININVVEVYRIKKKKERGKKNAKNLCEVFPPTDRQIVTFEVGLTVTVSTDFAAAL